MADSASDEVKVESCLNMSKTKKRTSKKTPQPRRKSTRERKQTEKGKYYDKHFVECNDPGVSAPGDQDGSSATQDDAALTLNVKKTQDLVPPVINIQEDLGVSTGDDLGPHDLSTPMVPIGSGIEVEGASNTTAELKVTHDDVEPDGQQNLSSDSVVDLVSEEDVTQTLSEGSPSTPVIKRVRSRSEPLRPLNIKLEIEMATFLN